MIVNWMEELQLWEWTNLGFASLGWDEGERSWMLVFLFGKAAPS